MKHICNLKMIEKEKKIFDQLRCVQTTDSTHYPSVRFDLENK